MGRFFFVGNCQKISLKKFSLKHFLFSFEYAIIKIEFKNEALYGGKNFL
jgi:hypothetical protein